MGKKSNGRYDSTEELFDKSRDEIIKLCMQEVSNGRVPNELVFVRIRVGNPLQNDVLWFLDETGGWMSRDDGFVVKDDGLRLDIRAKIPKNHPVWFLFNKPKCQDCTTVICVCDGVFSSRSIHLDLAKSPVV